MLEELIDQCIKAAADKVRCNTDFALTRHENGTWYAAIGGHWAVALGEWPGDFSAQGISATEALGRLIAIVDAAPVVD